MIPQMLDKILFIYLIWLYLIFFYSYLVVFDVKTRQNDVNCINRTKKKLSISETTL